MNPVFTQCCRQTYCSDCIHWWLKDHNKCPNDRQSLNTNGLSPSPLIVINLLNKMRIKCDFYSNGCQEMTKVSEMEKHIKTCAYNPIKECTKCGFTGDSSHNCIDYLILENKRLREENSRLATNQMEVRMRCNYKLGSN